MVEPLTISLVVATYGREKELKNLLFSLKSSVAHITEIIIVDQNDKIDLVPVIALFNMHLPVKHYKIGIKNASIARNYGAKKAVGAWLGFPDDDSEYTENTLSSLLKTIQTTGAKLVTGSITDFENVPLSNTYTKSTILSYTNAAGRLSEPCFFVERNTFLSVDGFNEQFGPGSTNFAGEGMELGYRLLRHKIRGFFNAELIVLHPNKMKHLISLDFGLIYRYSYANGRAIALHYPGWAFTYLFKDIALFLPRVILRPENSKARFLTTRICGLLTGILSRYKEK